MRVYLQGINPWIEVDGGVGPENAYKVLYERVTMQVTKASRSPAPTRAMSLPLMLVMSNSSTVKHKSERGPEMN
jgi:hypothetical protein